MLSAFLFDYCTSNQKFILSERHASASKISARMKEI